MKPRHSKSHAMTTTTVTEYANTILVGGGKGGLGKSMCALTLLYLLERANKATHLVEADTSNPDTAKALGNTEAGSNLPPPNMSLLNLDREDGWLDLLNLRAAHPERTFVISTGSRSNLAFEEFGPLLDAGLRELGAPLVTVWMIDGNRDCLELLSHYRQTISSGRFFIVRNSRCARSFEFYDTSNLRKEIEAAGGTSLTIPTLSERVAQTLNVNRLSFTTAQKSSALQFAHKIVLNKWLDSMGTALSEVTA